MREIKFRAWDKACDSMVKDEWKLYLNGGVSIDGTWATNDIELMQYTGLKDKNGKEIYEGDIVETSGGAGVVRYADDMGLYEVELAGHGSRGIHGYAEYQNERPPEFILNVKVIGNIYENPELME